MPALHKFALVFLGYLVAVCVAAGVTVAVMTISTEFPFGSGGPKGFMFSILSDLIVIILVGCVWTFICAWPGFIVAILIGEQSRWSIWPAYATAGLVNVIPSLAIFSAIGGSPGDIPLMIVGAFPGGFAGGAAYWIVAGRFIARNRKAEAG